jgi:fucose 4-O-acetylase-like acetyltransferase
MPLFMLVSGWNAKPQTPGRAGKTLSRLLPAAFCWYAIQYCAEQRYKTTAFSAYLLEFLKRPDIGLWFLWALAGCILFLVLCWRLEGRAGLKVYGVCAVVLALLPYPYLGVPLIKYYFPYLLIGYGLSRYSDRIRPAIRCIVVAAAILYPLVLIVWRQSYTPGEETTHFVLAGLRVPVQACEYAIVKYAAGCLGSILASGVAYILYARLHATVLAWLGRRSLEIYVSHQFFVYLFPSASFVAISAAFFVSLLSAVALAIVLKPVPVLGGLLYGEPLSLRWRFSKTWDVAA